MVVNDDRTIFMPKIKNGSAITIGKTNSLKKFDGRNALTDGEF